VRANTLANTSSTRGLTEALLPRRVHSAVREGPPLYPTSPAELRSRCAFRLDLRRPLRSILKSRVGNKRRADGPAQEEGRMAKRARHEDGPVVVEKKKGPVRQVAFLYGHSFHYYLLYSAEREDGEMSYDEAELKAKEEIARKKKTGEEKTGGAAAQA
jgi:hypothetical protein